MHYLEFFLKNAQRKMVVKRIIAILSVVVLLVTVNSTKLMADTLEHVPACGLEEHVHSDSCFDAEGNLICGLMEHIHTDACYQERPNGSARDNASEVEQPVDEAQEFTLGDSYADGEGAMPAGDSDTTADAPLPMDAPAAVNANIAAPVEEIENLELGTEEAETLDVEVTTPPEAEETHGYVVGNQYPIYLSDVIADQGLNLSIDDVVEIGQAIENDDDPVLFNYEHVDGDIALYVNQDFERTELVISSAEELRVVELLFGIAPMDETAAEDQEATIEEAVTDPVDGTVAMELEEAVAEVKAVELDEDLAESVEMEGTIPEPVELEEAVEQTESKLASENEDEAEDKPEDADENAVEDETDVVVDEETTGDAEHTNENDEIVDAQTVAPADIELPVEESEEQFVPEDDADAMTILPDEDSKESNGEAEATDADLDGNDQLIAESEGDVTHTDIDDEDQLVAESEGDVAHTDEDNLEGDSPDVESKDSEAETINTDETTIDGEDRAEGDNAAEVGDDNEISVDLADDDSVMEQTVDGQTVVEQTESPADSEETANTEADDMQTVDQTEGNEKLEEKADGEENTDGEQAGSQSADEQTEDQTSGEENADDDQDDGQSDGEKYEDNEKSEKETADEENTDEEHEESQSEGEKSEDQTNDEENAESGQDDSPTDGEKSEDQTNGEETADDEQNEDQTDEEENTDGEQDEDQIDEESTDGVEQTENDDEADGSLVIEGQPNNSADTVQQHPAARYSRYDATIDLSEVDEYPISLDVLMDQASRVDPGEAVPSTNEEPTATVEEVPAVEEAPVEEHVAAEEPPVEDAMGEAPAVVDTPVEIIESESIEPAQSEVTVELGGMDDVVQTDDISIVEAETIAPDVWILDYDASLISIERNEEGYALSVINSFDQTVVTVNNGNLYSITLLNGSAPVLFPAASFTASTEFVVVNVRADAGAFPEGTTMVVADVDDEDTINGITEKVEEDFVRVERVHAVDITFLNADGVEIEPLIPISVVMSVREIEEEKEKVVVHVDHAGDAQVVESAPAPVDEGNAEAVPPVGAVVPPVETNSPTEDVPAETPAPETAGTSIAFTADTFSVYAVVVGEKIETRVIAADGNAYRIEVTYSADAGIPAGATLSVDEVTEDEAYRVQIEAGLPGNKMITLARFFDIKIMNGNEEVQPRADVQVKVWMENERTHTTNDVNREGPEPAVSEVEAALDDEQGTAESFADEKEQTGKESVSDEDTAGFGDAAASAESVDHTIITSDPEPVAMHFVEREYETVVEQKSVETSEAAIVFSADSFSVWGVVYTVDFYYGNYEYHLKGGDSILLSGLLETLKIEKDVSDVEKVTFTNDALLKVEKIAFEDRQDWLLTSLMAFDTHETLRVSMTNGEIFVIDVTDAQALPSFTEIDLKRGYIIYTEKDNQYYVLRNDCQTVIVPKSPEAMENLGPEYLWRFEYRFNRDDSRFYILRTFGLDEVYTMRMWNGTWEMDKERDISWDNHVGLWEHPASHQLVIWGEGNPELRLFISENQIRANSLGPNYVAWFNLWEQDKRYFTVSTDDPRRGGVSGPESSDKDVQQFVSVTTGADGSFTNLNRIAATAANRFTFDHWELDGVPLSDQDYTALIEPGQLTIPQFGSALKAVFKRIQEQHYANYPPLENPDPLEVAEWIGSVLSADPLSDVDKTAEVYDYENRIYRVDLSAHSGFEAVAHDLTLAFVTDISNSMLFPEALYTVYDSNNQPVTVVSRDHSKDNSIGAQIEQRVQDRLMNTDQVYITVGDIAQSSTQYALFYAKGETSQYIDGTQKYGQYINGSFFEQGWWGLDASYYAKWLAHDPNTSYETIKNGGRWKQLNNTFHFAANEAGKNDYVYTIYEPNDEWFNSLTDTDKLYGEAWGSNRLFYLIESIRQALDQIQRIESRYPLGAIFAGLETFAGSTSTDEATILSQTLGTTDEWPDRHQDFVQIGGHTNYQGGNYETNKNLIINKLNNITTKDGTAQDIAIQKLRNILHWDVAERDHSVKKYVIMITDGAPNRRKTDSSDKAVRMPVSEIISAINAEKASGKSLDGVTLITIGLGINDVPGGQELLHSVASPNSEGKPLYYSARDGKDLLYILMEVVRSLMEEAAVEGDIQDVIDDAFYPVDKDTGLPVQMNQEGKAYIRLDGTVLNSRPSSGAYGEISYDSVHDKYTVNWTDQDFKPWLKGGWHGTIYLKAKENFLGGNTIKTNDSASMTPKKYHIIDDNGDKVGESVDIPCTGSTDHRRDPVPLETPHVNVDELSLTGNESEWTVYLDTEVSPIEALKALYSRIMVNEVVEETVGQHHVINNGNTSYAIVPDSAADNTQTVHDQEQFALTDIPGMGVDDINWATLIAQGKLENIDYTAYGHQAGKFTIELVKEIVEGAHSLDDDDENGVHTANPVGEAVEKYTLKVTYYPNDYDLSKKYHTGHYGSKTAGNPTDTMVSDNRHFINVFVRDIQITKTDENYSTALTGAEFALFRTAREGETSVYLEGAAGDYHLVDTLICDENGIARRTFALADLPREGEQYYLVETVAPNGYNRLSAPVPLTFTIDNAFTPLPDGLPAREPPASAPYNWVQTAVLQLESNANIRRTDEDGGTATNTGVQTNSDTETVYYKIANNPGFVLPATGGPGTTLYTLTGILLILGATFLLLRKKREY